MVGYEKQAIDNGSLPHGLCNLRQRPSFMASTATVPALLRRSFLWCLGLKRPLLPQEHLEVMGFKMFGDSPCSAALVLNSLTGTEQRSLAGNSMHMAAIGSVLMFLLAGVELA